MCRPYVQHPVSAPSELAPRSAFATALAQRLPGWASVDWVHAAGSTNTDLLADARQGRPLPALLGADFQSHGRGRSNRNFRADRGNTLTFSCAFEVRLPPAALPTLSVLGGLTACEALARGLRSDHALCLKWPNDLQWGEAKLAGLLLESAGAVPGQPARVVIGMGLNLRGGPALSLALGRAVADWEQAGVASSPADLCADVALAWRAAFAQAETEWRDGVGLPELPLRYAAHDALYGRPVNVLEGGRIVMQGTAEGVAPDGRLRVRAGADVALVSVGDVSVRADADALP